VSQHGTWVDHNGVEWPLPSPTQRLQCRTRSNAALRAFVHHRDNYTCKRCGFAAPPPVNYTGRYALNHGDRPLVIDHVLTLAAGGTTHPDNLQTLCDPCNASKGGTDDARARRSADLANYGSVA